MPFEASLIDFLSLDEAFLSLKIFLLVLSYLSKPINRLIVSAWSIFGSLKISWSFHAFRSLLGGLLVSGWSIFRSKKCFLGSLMPFEASFTDLLSLDEAVLGLKIFLSVLSCFSIPKKTSCLWVNHFWFLKNFCWYSYAYQSLLSRLFVSGWISFGS